MKNVKNKILSVSLCALLVAMTGCKDDNDLVYKLIPANLNPDKTSVVFNANANETEIMTNAATGSTWFVRKEGDVPATLKQTTDRIILTSVINDAVNSDDALIAKSGKVILSEETAGGLVVDKVTITVTQQYYRQASSVGTTDWDNGNPPAYSWTFEGIGANGQNDVVTIGKLQSNTYAVRVIGSVSNNIVVEDEGEGAGRTLKLSANKNDTNKALKGYLMITDTDGKTIYAVRPLTIGAKP